MLFRWRLESRTGIPSARSKLGVEYNNNTKREGKRRGWICDLNKHSERRRLNIRQTTDLLSNYSVLVTNWFPAFNVPGILT